MQFSFDLISDLNVESWPRHLDLTHQATSPICVVAGNVSGDAATLRATLQHISSNYQATLFIDGISEHIDHCQDLASNYKTIQDCTQDIKNLVYLHNNVCILHGVAFLATNGWWSWDFDPMGDVAQTQHWFCHHHHYHSHVTEVIEGLAESEAQYISNSIRRLQTHKDVERIVLITNAVPDFDLVSHDPALVGTYQINTMGNHHLSSALLNDTEHKIAHWCVGRYSGHIDAVRDGVHYVNNCRGRGDAVMNQPVYYPRRLTVDF